MMTAGKVMHRGFQAHAICMVFHVKEVSSMMTDHNELCRNIPHRSCGAEATAGVQCPRPGIAVIYHQGT